MYFGSVKFFRHIITLTVAFLILTLLIVVIALSVENRALKKDLEYSQNDVKSITATFNSFKKNSSETSSDQQSSAVEEQSSSQAESDVSKVEQENIDFEVPAYQSLYPELYSVGVGEYVDDTGCAYLTFDRCPSQNTLKLLDILDKENVKATFFISKSTIENEAEVLKEIVKRGHKIGIQSYGANLGKIYNSVAEYLDDLNKIYNYVYEVTGVKANLIRFAGGSINTYNSHIYREIIAEVVRRGFVYFDWNVSTDTSMSTNSPKKMYNTIVRDSAYADRLIILSNDLSSSANINIALPDIIKYLKEKDFKFEVLSNNVKPIVFGYKN